MSFSLLLFYLLHCLVSDLTTPIGAYLPIITPALTLNLMCTISAPGWSGGSFVWLEPWCLRACFLHSCTCFYWSQPVVRQTWGVLSRRRSSWTSKLGAPFPSLIWTTLRRCSYQSLSPRTRKEKGVSSCRGAREWIWNLHHVALSKQCKGVILCSKVIPYA